MEFPSMMGLSFLNMLSLIDDWMILKSFFSTLSFLDDSSKQSNKKKAIFLLCWCEPFYWDSATQTLIYRGGMS